MPPSFSRSCCGLCLLSIVVISGCATTPYQFGSAQRYRTSAELEARTVSQPIERGQPNKFLDTFGWVWGIPDKIILWDRRIDNHDIGPQTEAAIADYLAKNELSSVKVRLNQYHPGDDWRRLAANDSVGPGWRYTLGTFSVLGETIFPGRLFGGDHFNPFTNTIHVYSDVPAVAVHEAGHSKDFARREWKGTYAAVYLIPGVPLYHEAKATNDALGYLLTESDEQTQKDAYEILYPAYGTYVGGALGGVFSGYGTYAASVIGGHLYGRYKSDQISDGSLPESQRVEWSGIKRSSIPPLTKHVASDESNSETIETLTTNVVDEPERASVRFQGPSKTGR